MGTKVYKFRLLDPVENVDVIHQQMRDGHRFRNDLIQIERGRRDAVRAALSEVSPDLAQLEVSVQAAQDAVEAVLTKIREYRVVNETKRDTPELRAELKAAKDHAKAAKSELWAAQAKVKSSDEYRLACDRINDLAKELVKSARAYSPAYWGTRGEHEVALEDSRKAPLFDGIEPNDPDFRRWGNGDSFLAVQIVTPEGKPPLTTAKLFGTNTMCTIDPVPTWSKGLNKRGEPRPKLPLLRMRIDSDGPGGRIPIWGAWPIIQHRDMPADGAVKRVRVVLRHIGPRPEWHVCFTVQTADETVAAPGHGAVGINFGWRRVEGGIRVATWANDLGDSGDVVLPEEVLSGLRKADEIEGVRDKNFNETRLTLQRWIAAREQETALPEWFVAATRYIAQWRSQERLTNLVSRWEAQRFDGDAEIFASVAAWDKQDLHLWRWASSQRKNSERRRQDFYRVIGARLAERYARVYVDGADFAQLARRAEQGTEDPQKERLRDATSNTRHGVAPGELRSAIEQAAKSRGAHCEQVPPEQITHQCHKCGNVESFKAAAYVHHACRKCHVIWDQDVNAAVNTLDRGEQRSAERSAAPARDEETQSKPKGRRAKMAAALEAKRVRQARSQTGP